jgi:hypothetical protein
MSTPTAKDLLAQADRLMRQRIPEELPVLTDLVIEEIEVTSVSDRADDARHAPARPGWAPPQPKPVTVPFAPPPPSPVQQPASGEQRADMRTRPAVDMLGVRPVMSHDVGHVPSADPTTVTAVAKVRDQFNAQLLTKLEELQHGVYSQVMQQLEIYAAGSLKEHVRDRLMPALTDIVRDIATQVAEDTSTQVREVVSKAVESEIARLRDQLSKRRVGDGRG